MDNQKQEDPSHFTNREIHRRATEARDAALKDVAAGMGLDIAFVQERANVGRKRIEAAGGDVDLAVERAVRGD